MSTLSEMLRPLGACFSLNIEFSNVQKETKNGTVREVADKSAAGAASLDYVQFQAVIKSAASAACPGEAALAAKQPT